MSQLRRHLGCLDALADVMQSGGSIEECVLAIETCENIRGGPVGMVDDYELVRRKQFRSQQAGFVERFLLGDKNIDFVEDRLVEGKGGGYQRPQARLTGDDPLYAAIAVALGFLCWASNGGLSLH
jgi:hypothetical protein